MIAPIGNLQVTKPILGPDGKPIRAQDESRIRASVDVGYTTHLNAEHWAFATSGDANVNIDYGKRRQARLRGRYEVMNNAILFGMCQTKCDDTIGVGPSLQMIREGDEEIERSWTAWTEEICLAEKLWSLWMSKIVDGEGLALIVENPDLEHEIPLDLMGFESEQMGNPGHMRDDYNRFEGVEHVRNDPKRYYVYDRHPDSYFVYAPPAYYGDWYPPSRVIHLYTKRRPGQHRGISELVPALPLAAIHRRWTMATLGSAETAADVSLWLETDSPPDDPTRQDIDPFSTVPFERNMVVSAPFGWKIHQLRVDQPTTGYDMFSREIILQMGRAMKLPAALAYGDSSDYNMASGRLDFQTYIRSVGTDRRMMLELQCMEKIFLAWMRYYLSLRSGIAPSDIDPTILMREHPHLWSWRPINHSDPEKQANADVALWEKGLLTDDAYLYRQNINPEHHHRQLERSIERRKKLGLPLPGIQPGMQGLAGGTAAANEPANSQ